MKNIVDNISKDVFLKFLKETKEGVYSEINKDIIETPRTVFSRDEFIFDEELPLLYSISTQI